MTFVNSYVYKKFRYGFLDQAITRLKNLWKFFWDCRVLCYERYRKFRWRSVTVFLVLFLIAIQSLRVTIISSVRLLMARFFYTSTWERSSSEPHVTVQQVYFVTEVIRLNKKCQVKKTVRVWSFSLVIVSRVRCVCVWLPSMSNCNSMFHTFSASATSFVSQETVHTSRWECKSFFKTFEVF